MRKRFLRILFLLVLLIGTLPIGTQAATASQEVLGKYTDPTYAANPDVVEAQQNPEISEQYQEIREKHAGLQNENWLPVEEQKTDDCEQSDQGDFMERNTADILCFIIVFFVGLAFVFDLLGVAWAMIRKKPYKSILGNFIERFLDHPSLFWLPVLIAILYLYFFLVAHPY